MTDPVDRAELDGFLGLVRRADVDAQRRFHARDATWRALAARGLEVRVALGRVEALPPWLVVELAQDAAAPVRAQLAERADLPHALLERLARDVDASVRLALFRSSACPYALLAEALRDPSIAVRLVVRRLIAARRVADA